MNSNLKVAIILVVVFAIGVMAGIVYTNRTDDRPHRNPRFDPFRADPEVIKNIERRIVDNYGLSEEQALAVRKILKDVQNKYDAFFHKTRPAFDQIRRAQQLAIKELMTPEQIEKFEAWLEERRKNRQRHGGRPDREGGPRPQHGPRPLKVTPPPSEEAPSNN